MDTAAIERELVRRIAESRSWLQSRRPPVLEGLAIRGCDCVAEPIEFLDSADRKERHGLGFRITIKGPKKDIEVQLNVRLKPEATVGARGDSPPYVVVYVVNQQTFADSEITHEHLDRPKCYTLWDYPIDEWYRTWLSRALRSKTQGKVFRQEMKIE